MPRLAIKHENTIMYKLVCNDLNITDLYVGSTTNFTKRKSQHKDSCCNEGSKCHHYKVYQFIRVNGGWGNWSMVEIEKFTCDDSNEAYKRERFWMESLNATLNCQVPSRSQSESKQIYREQHRESISISNKIYNDQHKEENAVKSKKNYIANIERYKEKYTCECGGKYTLKGKSGHLRTTIHLTHIENPELTILNSLRTPLEIENQHKELLAKLKESHAILNKNYRAAHRERLHEKFDCECGGAIYF